MGVREYICGWYFKRQNGRQTLAVIPVQHGSGRERSSSEQMAKALLELLWTERKESVLIAIELIKCFFRIKTNETQSDTVTIQAKMDKANC